MVSIVFVLYLSRFPSCPRLSAGTCLFQETKYFFDALRVGEELGERSGPAVSSEMLTSCGCIEWAFVEHMLDGLYRFAAGAGDLFLSVAGVETLGVLPCESMTSDKAYQCCVCES